MCDDVNISIKMNNSIQLFIFPSLLSLSVGAVSGWTAAVVEFPSSLISM